jgi:hypothetical protein
MKNTLLQITKKSFALLTLSLSVAGIASAAFGADDLSAYEQKQAILNQQLRATVGKKQTICTGNPVGTFVMGYTILSVDPQLGKVVDPVAIIKLSPQISPKQEEVALKIKEIYFQAVDQVYRLVLDFEPATFKIGPDGTPNNQITLTAIAFGAMEQISDHEGVLLPYNGISGFNLGGREGGMVLTCLDVR